MKRGGERERGMKERGERSGKEEGAQREESIPPCCRLDCNT